MWSKVQYENKRIVSLNAQDRNVTTERKFKIVIVTSKLNIFQSDLYLKLQCNIEANKIETKKRHTKEINPCI